jgi:hypothetical protein
VRDPNHPPTCRLKCFPKAGVSGPATMVNPRRDRKDADRTPKTDRFLGSSHHLLLDGEGEEAEEEAEGVTEVSDPSPDDGGGPDAAAKGPRRRRRTSPRVGTIVIVARRRRPCSRAGPVGQR